MQKNPWLLVLELAQDDNESLVNNHLRVVVCPFLRFPLAWQRPCCVVLSVFTYYIRLNSIRLQAYVDRVSWPHCNLSLSQLCINSCKSVFQNGNIILHYEINCKHEHILFVFEWFENHQHVSFMQVWFSKWKNHLAFIEMNFKQQKWKILKTFNDLSIHFHRIHNDKNCRYVVNSILI